MVNIDSKLIQTPDDSAVAKVNLPIISLDIVSVDKSHIHNWITHLKFDNYIDLKFKINDTLEEKYKINTIRVPTKEISSKSEFDQSIIVYRIDMKTIGHLFVTLTNLTYDLRVSCLYKHHTL